MRLATSAPGAFAALALCATLAHAAPAGSIADRTPLVGLAPGSPAAPVSANPAAGLIVVVDPASLPCLQSATFEDVAGGANPGVDYDGVLASGGVFFAERFAGQSVGSSGDFDVVSGSPSNPLVPQPGAPGQNLDVFAYSSNVLTGLGHLGYPDIDAIGEGAIAMFFPVPQSQVSFWIVGGNGGAATLQFYRADGSLIDTVSLGGLGDTQFGFATASGLPLISGILVQNTDPSGIGIDDVCHDPGITRARAATWGGFKSAYR